MTGEELHQHLRKSDPLGKTEIPVPFHFLELLGQYSPPMLRQAIADMATRHLKGEDNGPTSNP